MLYRENTLLGTKISAIGFGGAAISGEGGGYGFGNMSETQAETLLKEAWDAGINLFDTAPIYGFGLSEERFGKYLPKDAIIVTKGGVDWHENKRVNMSNDPKVIERMLLESLKRLKRETIDLYMIHWPDPRVDIRRPMEVLKKYKEQGVIRHLGLCNPRLEDLHQAQEIDPIIGIQSELNVLNTQAFDQLNDEWKNYFSMSWGTFDKGILTGRVSEKRKYDASDARSWAPWWNKKEVLKKIERVKKLEAILVDYNLSLMQFCLQFNAHHFGIKTSLIGVKSFDDLSEVIAKLHSSIPKEIMMEVITNWDG